MANARTWTVARWEFLRFVKLRDLVIGTLVFAVLYGAGSMFGEFAGRKLDDTRVVAVVEPERMGLDERIEVAGLALEPRALGKDALDSLLVMEEIDAALVPTDEGAWELRVRRERNWMQGVQVQLTVLLQQARLAELDLDPQVLAAITTPPALRTVVIDPPRSVTGKQSPVTALLFVGLMMMGLFVGFSYVFVAITGEKTQRVTESMLSTLRPQEWVDGKIIGLTGVVMVNLASAVIGYALWSVVGSVVFGQDLGATFHWNPLAAAVSLALAVLGFAFWFTFFAMIAATIDDPNSSSRSAFMFLPMVPVSLVFGGLDQADAPWMRILSVLPGVSQVAMPVRLLRGEPQWWEIALALALLALAAAWFRRAAGRIFGTSMLMTGKEPGLGEVLRWLRESGR